MYGDQDARRRHSVKTENISFESVEVFKYLRTTLSNEDFFQVEIKSGFKSGNVYFHLLQ
jgi:hypothetical protein